MLYAEKLDFLMKITNTSNSRLAHVAKLDTSYISRLRSGKRKPAKNENYTEIFSDYFARHIVSDYQHAAFREEVKIKPDQSPFGQNELHSVIYQWLKGSSVENAASVSSFVDKLSVFPSKKPIPHFSDYCRLPESSFPANSRIYFGNSGKREAVIDFLNIALSRNTPSELLLFSEEDMSWLTESPEYLAQWAAIMTQIIAKGFRIKIIHNLNRSLDEMFSAISQWMPIYFTGAIESYYFPKRRDGIFNQTMFIVPETAAVISNTIIQNESSANFLYTDALSIKAFTDEFFAYLKLCRPLIHVFSCKNLEKYYSMLHEFENKSSDCIMKSVSLSAISMPAELFISVLKRSDIEIPDKIIEYQKQRIVSFKNSLSHCSFVEIISLPEASKLKGGNVRIGFSDIISQKEIFYSVDEYKLHLRHITELMEKYDNYRVFIAERDKNNLCQICVKEDIGVIIAKSGLPSAMFAINESNMTSAFWDYMKSIIKKLPRSHTSKKYVMHQLNKYIDELEG